MRKSIEERGAACLRDCIFASKCPVQLDIKQGRYTCMYGYDYVLYCTLIKDSGGQIRRVRRTAQDLQHANAVPFLPSGIYSSPGNSTMTWTRNSGTVLVSPR